MYLNHIDIKELKKQGDVEGLLDILNNGSIKEKREAAFILGELKSRKAAKSLIGLLRKDDVQIRANSAWALGEIGKKDAVLPLIELLNDTSRIVQLHAAWALGRIGDVRAIPELYVAMKSSSAEFRNVAKDAIARIQEGREIPDENEPFFEDADPPLVALNIPENFIFKYPSLEGESKHESTIKITNGVIIEDTGDGKNLNSLRKVTVGLENPQNVSVSIDILFRCMDRTTGETKSAWLQLGNTGILNSNQTADIENADKSPLPFRGYDLEEIEEKRDIKKKKEIQRPGRPVENVQDDEERSEYKERPIRLKRIEKEIKEINKDRIKKEIHEEINEDIQEKIREEIKKDKQEKTLKEKKIEPPAKTSSVEKTEKIPLRSKPEENENKMDTAVKLLGDIGLSGMENAASTVTQFSGQEPQTQLRTLPIEELKGEIASLGDSIVLVEVRLNGKEGDMNGKMQIYFSRDTGIEIANELLCNPPEAFCREFSEDVMSTLREVVNIFGGQYVNAISEYVGETILVDTPKFVLVSSLQVAESVMKDIDGKVEFVLASDISLGKNRTGRLILLLDPKSYDKIVSKLF